MPTATSVVAATTSGSIPHVGNDRSIDRLALVVKVFLMVLLSSALVYAQEPRGSSTDTPKWYETLCRGKCAATILVGKQLDTGLAHVDGTSSFVPPWDYQYGDSYFVGVALSYSLVELFQAVAIEIEGGTGQRFGMLHETEGWVAFYARWKLFPWNDYLRTSFAVSTGLNYASGVTAYETSQSASGLASRLLHYFSPEITFALPSRTDMEFVIRIHHRSGGGDYFGNDFPVYGSLFHGMQGGMQYLTFGLRRHF